MRFSASASTTSGLPLSSTAASAARAQAAAPEPGADRDHVGALHRLAQLAATSLKPRQISSGPAGGDRHDVLGRHRHGDQSGAGAQAGLAGQARGPGHARAAADDEHAAEVALVAPSAGAAAAPAWISASVMRVQPRR